MKSLEPFAPFWRDDQLHLAVLGEHALLLSHPVVVGRDAITLRGITTPREHIQWIRLEPAHPEGCVLTFVSSQGYGHRSQLVTYTLRSQPMGPIYELIRVLRLWLTDATVQHAWGTSDVEAVLVPSLDGELLLDLEGEATLSGLAFPCVPVPDPLVPLGVGLTLLLLVAVVNLVPLVFVLPTGLALVASVGGAWAVRTAHRTRRPPVLLVTQHALLLPDGTALSFDGIDSVHGSPTGLLVNTANAHHPVAVLHGDGIALAAALSARITPPGSAPAALDAIRTRSVDPRSQAEGAHPSPWEER